MSDEVLIAVVSAVGLVLSGVLVELVRTRRKLTAEVSPNGGSSMRDAVDRSEKAATEIKGDLKEIRTELSRQGQRLAAVEALQSQQLLMHHRAGGD